MESPESNQRMVFRVGLPPWIELIYIIPMGALSLVGMMILDLIMSKILSITMIFEITNGEACIIQSRKEWLDPLWSRIIRRKCSKHVVLVCILSMANEMMWGYISRVGVDGYKYYGKMTIMTPAVSSIHFNSLQILKCWEDWVNQSQTDSKTGCKWQFRRLSLSVWFP